MLSVVIGFIISSAMPAIIVYAQELMPHRFGMISGLFFGLAFGIGGIGAAVLGHVADRTGIDFVYQICAFLPAIGLLAIFLPQTQASTRLTFFASFNGDARRAFALLSAVIFQQPFVKAFGCAC